MGQVYRALETTEFEWDVEEFRGFVNNHPQSERIRWWKAKADPTYTQVKGTTAASGGGKFARVEQTDAGLYLALIQGAQVMRRFVDQGALETGDLVITTMPDELPLTEHDWIVPMGRVRALDDAFPEARVFPMKEVITRGGNDTVGAGTVVSSGINVTGTGTAFLSFFRAGDIVRVSGKGWRVQSAPDDTHLVLASAPSPVWTGNAYTKGVDRLTFPIGAWIESAETTDTAYQPQADCRIGDDGETVQWDSVTISPAPGTRYAITYWYYPRYVVLGDLGLRRHVVGGQATPQRVVARLWKPEAFRE